MAQQNSNTQIDVHPMSRKFSSPVWLSNQWLRRGLCHCKEFARNRQPTRAMAHGKMQAAEIENRSRHFLEVYENDDERTIYETARTFHEIARMNLVLISCGFVDRRLVFVWALEGAERGPTESLLTLDSWDEIVGANPILKGIEPDVEALLVNRVRSAREYYIAPIDECYKLVGLIRAHWRGLSGGTEVWNEIDGFFKTLKEHSLISRGQSSPIGTEYL
jgi:hypothetical protein